MLKRIAADRMRDEQKLQSLISPGEFMKVVSDMDRARDFSSIFAGEHVSVIAELKVKSPSRGFLMAKRDPVALAKTYVQSGAKALSVVTEPRYFNGSDDMVTAVSDLGVPVLRKDFITTPYFLYQARALGADAQLLIAALLDGDTLQELIAIACDIGICPVVEIHTDLELKRAVSAGAGVIMINNRDLKTMTVDRNTTIKLGPTASRSASIIAASGIHGRDHVVKMTRSGAGAVLVGEHLLTSSDPGSTLTALTGVKRDSR